jgi:hypothetical protein
MTAEDVIAALRKRHPAFDPQLAGVGRWTTIREWQNIDLLALDAWRAGDVIGYEVKVSRSDMRSELLDPSKRARAVAMCTRFYFAVPAGMLTPAEREWQEPEWSPEDFVRAKCTNPGCTAKIVPRGWHRSSPKPRGAKLRGTPREGVSVRLGYVTERGEHPAGGTYSHTIAVEACCAVCKGYGTTAKSRVEEVAPTLWVPRDVGLVAVGPRGCAVLREAPRRTVTEPIIPWPYLGYAREDGPTPRRSTPPKDRSRLERQAINTFARWVSARPDPRHSRRATDASSDGARSARLLETTEPELDDDVDEPRAMIG